MSNMPEHINKLPLGTLFRTRREEKGLLIRQVAAVTELDQAIISRIENCDRLPTKEQLLKLAGLYNLDIKETTSAWLAERMMRDYGNEPYVSDALRDAHERIMFSLEYDSNTVNESSDYPAQTKKTKRVKRKPG